MEWGRRSFALGALRVLFLAPPLLLARSASAREEQKVGKVAALEGRAIVLRPGVDRHEPLALDGALFRADVVQTAATARARLAFDDGTVVTMGELTTLRVVRAGAPPSGARFSVPAGVVRLVAQHRSGRPHAEVVTPTAVAAVRGTEWLVDASGPGTGIAVLSGQVLVSSAHRDVKGSVIVKAGEGTDVAPGRAPTPPAPWGKQRLDALSRATTLP